MPTNRTRRRRQPRRDDMPVWAARLLAGELPTAGSEDHEGFIAWYFFGSDVIGLPAWDTTEGRAILAAAREAA